MSIPPQTWAKARRDYVRGVVASLPAVAIRHGLKVKTVGNRAQKEKWTALRREFQRRQLKRLAPVEMAGTSLSGTFGTGSAANLKIEQGHAAAWLAGRLDRCEQQQQRIEALLNRPGVNKRDCQHLFKALMTLQDCWLRWFKALCELEAVTAHSPESNGAQHPLQ